MIYEEAYTAIAREIIMHYDAAGDVEFTAFKTSPQFTQGHIAMQFFLSVLNRYNFNKPPRATFVPARIDLNWHLQVLYDALKILYLLQKVPYLTRRELRLLDIDISIDELLSLEFDTRSQIEPARAHLELFVFHFHPHFMKGHIYHSPAPFVEQDERSKPPISCWPALFSCCSRREPIKTPLLTPPTEESYVIS